MVLIQRDRYAEVSCLHDQLSDPKGHQMQCPQVDEFINGAVVTGTLCSSGGSGVDPPLTWTALPVVIT